MSNVDHPQHYNRFSREVIDLVKDMGFCQGNALKYILRAPFKGHFAEDLRKAAWYLRMLDKFVLTEAQRKMLFRFAEEMLGHSPELSLTLEWIAHGIRPSATLIAVGDIIHSMEERK